MDRSIHLSFHLFIINTIYDVIQNYILHHIADKIASISFVSQYSHLRIGRERIALSLVTIPNF